MATAYCPCYVTSMPVCHFTFHAFGTWLPDRPEGYYKHGSSWQPPNPKLADHHRSNMPPPITFTPAQQQALLDELIKTQAFQRTELYAAGIDPSHAHAVVAWQDDRDPINIRAQLKSSLTRMMNTRFGKRQWFVAKAGQTAVTDHDHLHDLVHNYLPKHKVYWHYKSK